MNNRFAANPFYLAQNARCAPTAEWHNRRRCYAIVYGYAWQLDRDEHCRCHHPRTRSSIVVRFAFYVHNVPVAMRILAPTDTEVLKRLHSNRMPTSLTATVRDMPEAVLEIQCAALALVER